jgi:integrase/recombinase XerD
MSPVETGESGPRDAVRRSFHLPRFLDHLRFERGLSNRTLTAYDHDVMRLVVFLAGLGREEPGAAAGSDLRAFVLGLKDVGLEPGSIARNISALRTYFRFLLTEGLVESDPSERIQ